MRNVFINSLEKQCRDRSDVWFLTGDLGFSVLEGIKETLGERFINMGVAEQNMVGVATGLALSGKTVFVYSITNFATFRCYEQIRNDICYHNANVKLISVGAGLAYGSHGYTHHGIEDMAALRPLPNLEILVPADHNESRLMVPYLFQNKGPAYVRLEQAISPELHTDLETLNPPKAIRIKNGTDVLLAVIGSNLHEALNASRLLGERGIDAAVWSYPWLKPFDEDSIRQAARKYNLIVTIEESTIYGAFGSQVAEILADTSNCSSRMIRLGVDKPFFGGAMSRQGAKELFNLTAESITDKVEKAIKVQE